jgi:hypothetical protein
MVPRRDEPARRAREGVAGTTSSALDAADVQAAMPTAWLWIAGGNPYLRILLGATPEGQGHIWRMAALLDWQIVTAICRTRALPCAKSALVTAS